MCLLVFRFKQFAYSENDSIHDGNRKAANFHATDVGCTLGECVLVLQLALTKMPALAIL